MAPNINKTEVGNMDNTRTDFSVSPETTDGATGSESRWTDSDFTQNFGYFKTIPELKSTITTKSKWLIGKGVKADKETMKILDKWRGWGKDTKNTLIQNMSLVTDVGGNFFAEIIRDDSIFRKIMTWFGILEKGKPVNIKPLDPSTITTITNDQGMILRYEQNANIENRDTIMIKSEDMFHLAQDRFADEIHGTGIVSVIEKIILMRNEAMADIKTVFHRYVKPLWVWQLDTDDETKIKAFKEKADRTVEESENIYIPKGAAEAERVSVPQFSTLDPLPWIRDLTDYFYQATNTPDVVVGSAKSTVEASAKILFLGFEQSVRAKQLFIRDNFKTQLGLDIELEFPTPIESDLLRDAEKDGDTTKPKPEDTKINLEGKK
jgi:hypothetical protein